MADNKWWVDWDDPLVPIGSTWRRCSTGRECKAIATQRSRRDARPVVRVEYIDTARSCSFFREGFMREFERRYAGPTLTSTQSDDQGAKDG